MEQFNLLNVTECEPGILQIVIARPQALNALNAEVMRELTDAFLLAKQKESIRALLLTGEGKAFCAGADIQHLSTLTATTGLAFANHGQKVFSILEQLGKPSIAAINGYAFGGGLELAMAATIRIAAENATFGQPEIKLGVIPGFGGTQRLSRLIGKGRALELCLTGKTMNAHTALQSGLVTEVVGLTDLLTRSHAILHHLIALPKIAQQSLLTVINQGYDLSLEEGLALEAAHFGLCCATQDKKEGVNAFLEKRTPNFIGE
jgi:enoyl-CoA hydratase